MIGVADGTEALGDFLSLRAAPLVLKTRRVRLLLDLLQPCVCLWGTTWVARFWLAATMREPPPEIGNRRDVLKKYGLVEDA